jgi:putative transcriptional regulator
MPKDANTHPLVWDHHYESGKELRPGSILISEPFMLDPNFKKAVVLITEHSKADGTVGFILNRPLEFTLGEVIEEMEECAMELNYGGPVEQDTLHYIHKLGTALPNAINIGNGLYWGGNFDALKDLYNSGSISENDIKFYLGYAGWSHDQLMSELEENSWVIHHGNREIVFEYAPEDMWKKVLGEMGKIYQVLSNYPENPSLN